MKPLPFTALALLLLAGLAQGAKLRVPADHATIQAAVGASSAGDVIEVSAGTYFENVVVDSLTDLTLRARGKDKVIIDGGGGSPAIRVSLSTGIKLKNLRVRDATSGIFFSSSFDCAATGCRAASASTAGIRLSGGERITIEGCRVEDSPGDGIVVDSDLCLIADCSVSEVGGDGIHLLAADLITVLDNRIDLAAGHGINNESTPNSLIQQNRIAAPGSYGIVCFAPSTACSLLENRIADSGSSAIYIETGATHHMVMDNVVNGTEGFYGISANGDEVQFRGNKIKNTINSGIFVWAGTSGCLFHENQVKKSGLDGFAVVGTGNALIGNKSSKNPNLDCRDPNPAGSNFYAGNQFGSFGS
ncbi:MAG: right-handed parallel beta-helix repeat-containing protein [Planctomycetes bacterium]|nr:right-handed parallel beta-helix repeat-containing protein [Planctomycetota bacterium]